MNEVVKYSNELHKINFSALGEAQQNILFTLLYEIKHQNTDFLELDIDKISELAEINTHNQGYFLELLNSLTRFQDLKFRYEIDEHGNLRQEVIFPILETQIQNNKIFIKVSQGFRERFLLVNNAFTRYELAEFVSLSSKYTKTIYRYLKQFRHNGFWKINYSEFKELLGIPKSYKTCDIDKQIIKPTLKELQKERNLFDMKRTPFKNLKVKKIKGKGKGRGGAIETLEFTFTAENTDNKKTKAEKKEIADQRAENAERKFSQQFSGKKIKDNNGILWIIFSISQAENEKIIADMQRADDYNIRKNFNFDSLEKLKNLVEKYETENPKKERGNLFGNQ